jgi:hypothetical protein
MMRNPVFQICLVVLLLFSLVSCGGEDKQTAQTLSSEAVQSQRSSVPQVPALEAQFRSINADMGYPFTFRYPPERFSQRILPVSRWNTAWVNLCRRTTPSGAST